MLMIYKFKKGDDFLEVDSNFSSDQVDTFGNMMKSDDFENDTIEIKLDELNGEYDE